MNTHLHTRPSRTHPLGEDAAMFLCAPGVAINNFGIMDATSASCSALALCVASLTSNRDRNARRRPCAGVLSSFRRVSVSPNHP